MGQKMLAVGVAWILVHPAPPRAASKPHLAGAAPRTCTNSVLIGRKQRRMDSRAWSGQMDGQAKQQLRVVGRLTEPRWLPVIVADQGPRPPPPLAEPRCRRGRYSSIDGGIRKPVSRSIRRNGLMRPVPGVGGEPRAGSTAPFRAALSP